MDEDMSAMARGSYGYGRWEAPYWFLGLEQGRGKHENNDLKARIEAWIKLGRKELNDCREFHRCIEEMRWHFKKPNVDLQSTWRPLILLLMTFLGEDTRDEALRTYQRDEWGTLHGQTCVIELSGLASADMKQAKDTSKFLPERILIIRQKLKEHRPQLVVM